MLTLTNSQPSETLLPPKTITDTTKQIHAHDRVGRKYEFISTDKIINDLALNNWHLDSKQEARVRKEENRGFQKFLLRFREGFNPVVHGNVKEIIIKGDHMGRSSIEFMLGFFECMCLNGIEIKCTTQEHRIRHTGYTEEKVAIALNSILNEADQAEELRRAMQGKLLHDNKRREFASRTLDIFFNDGFDPNKFNRSRTIENLIQPQRYHDAEQQNTVWGQLNIIQEKYIKGCNDNTMQKGFLVKNNFERKKNNPINNIDRRVKINQDIFALAEKFLVN